jgi:hypothetical protein
MVRKGLVFSTVFESVCDTSEVICMPRKDLVYTDGMAKGEFEAARKANGMMRYIGMQGILDKK